MRFRFLGTGTSQGVPMINCQCEVCSSPDPRNKRFRPSILVEAGDLALVVDTTPDFRSQCLANDVRRLDAILVTHAHADHVLGLDDVRRFCDKGRRVLPLYAARDHLEMLGRIFPHAFDPALRMPGWPAVDGYPIEPFKSFTLGPMVVTPMEVLHGPSTTTAFLFEEGADSFAYLTDCKVVPDAVIGRLRGVKVLVLDALRHRPHANHLNVREALGVVARVNPARTYFTHICHELDHAATEDQLPPGVRLACDGLVVDV